MMGRPARTEAREATREETGRNKRVPLGVSRTKLAVPQRNGYVRRWVNDSEGRLQMAEQGGYQFATDQSLQIGDPDIDNVNRDLGARVSRVVDKTTGQKAYLMEIKEEFYEEDQKAKAAKIDEVDQRIRKGKLEKVDDQYIPDNGRGIKFETR